MSTRMKNPPSARVLMNSMRSIGYTFESAVADIIDNSITAKATEILLNFPTNPNYCILTICDNGVGMSKATLYEAMKYGSCVNEERSEDDLGRFGLGLKSASLSQCKKLTVLSKFNNKIHGYAWDMDSVDEDWLMDELTDEEINKIYNINQLQEYETGTLVVWENFDLIQKSSGNVFSYLNDEMEEVSNYLSLIFHRFLNDSLDKRVSIKVNNYTLEGIDPFLEKHKKTDPRKEIVIPIKDGKNIERFVVVKPFVLPYQKDLSTIDKKMMGGVDSYNTKQGFYVYRNKRLIIWGTWFRMKPNNELAKNARIRVDIPNTLDDIWGIDIKKQTATLPKVVRNQLVRAVEEAMDIAITRQRYRGRVSNINSDIDYIWDRYEIREKKFNYRINRNSKIFDFLREVNDQDKARFEMILDEIEQNIPYQQIYIDMCDDSLNDKIDEERYAEIESKAIILIDIAIRCGRTREDAINDLFKSEPFCHFKNMKVKFEEK